MHIKNQNERSILDVPVPWIAFDTVLGHRTTLIDVPKESSVKLALSMHSPWISNVNDQRPVVRLGLLQSLHNIISPPLVNTQLAGLGARAAPSRQSLEYFYECAHVAVSDISLCTVGGNRRA